MLARTAACLLIASSAAIGQDAADWNRMVKSATLTLGDAIDRGIKEAGGHGVPFHAELEQDKGVVLYSIDVAQGAKTFNVVFDARDGKVVERQLESGDHSDLAKSSYVGLLAAIASALKTNPGTPVEAEATLKDGKVTVVVKVFAEGNLTTVKVDGASGEVLSAKAPKQKAEKPDKFTDTFQVDDRDWSSTGSNPFFVLEPGWFLVLEGKDEGQDARLTITVLDEVRKIAGVETRVVEEREEVGGKLIEVSRNFFAISKKTNSVYYFGEEVDIYKDGKVASHDGAWVTGEKEARFGLIMPGTPLLGARYYQEVAPGVAMDRAEIIGLGETLETPAGKLEKCLKTEETTPFEKGKTSKLYAPGIGLIHDGELKLARYGRLVK